MKLTKKLLFPVTSFSILLFIIFFTVKIAHAQLDVESITITPPTIKITVNPGDKKEGQLGIINDSSTDLTFLVATYDFIVTDNNGTPQVLPYGTISNNKYSAANWIAAAPTSFNVKAHTRYNLNYYIQVPKDAAPGGHYAAIVYQPVEANAQPGSGAHIQTQIATLAYITVNGPINEFAKITSFKAPTFQEYGPVQIATEIRNYGDLHINPKGSISVKDMFGKVVTRSPLQDRNIFPGNVALTYSNTLGSKYMIGKFTATVLASYGIHNNLPLSATVTFWVFPWKVSIVIVLIIIALILALQVLRTKKKRTPPTSEVIPVTTLDTPNT